MVMVLPSNSTTDAVACSAVVEGLSRKETIPKDCSESAFSSSLERNIEGKFESIRL